MALLETLQSLIAAYGYWAVALGCVLEGEVSLLLGAIAAQQGLLRLDGVMLAAFGGTMISDIGFFYVGRYYGRTLLSNRSRRLRARARLAERLLARHGAPVIVGFRFLLGLRSVAALAFGTLNVPPWRFVLLSGLGAALWTIAFSIVGVLLANAFLTLIRYIREVKLVFLALLVLVLLIAGGAYLLRLRRARKERRQTGPNDQTYR